MSIFKTITVPSLTLHLQLQYSYLLVVVGCVWSRSRHRCSWMMDESVRNLWYKRCLRFGMTSRTRGRWPHGTFGGFRGALCRTGVTRIIITSVAMGPCSSTKRTQKLHQERIGRLCERRWGSWCRGRRRGRGNRGCRRPVVFLSFQIPQILSESLYTLSKIVIRRRAF